MKPIFFIISILVLSACNKSVEHIAEWRGGNRSGIYNETNLLKAWPENGPALLWENNDLGSGYGSPTITNDKLFIVGTDDSLSYLIAFDLDGNLIYKSVLGNEWVVNYPGSRCAPTIVENWIYVMTGAGDVLGMDAKTGRINWKLNMISDLHGESPLFGYSEALLVDEDKVFCCPGGIENNVVALNRYTGDVIWSCKGKGERSGYNPPKLIQTSQRKIFTTFSAYHFMGIDVENGELLWVHEQVNTPEGERRPGMGDTHANTVLFENNVIYYVEGDGNCAVALQLSKDGTGINQLWNNVVVDNYMGGIVKIDNFIYSCGFSGNNLVKVDAQTGAVVSLLSIGRGALIAADNMLYYYNTKGEVHLVDYQSEEIKSVSSFYIEMGSGEHFAHPVIHNGVLYIRHGEFLGAYNINTHL